MLSWTTSATLLLTPLRFTRQTAAQHVGVILLLLTVLIGFSTLTDENFTLLDGWELAKQLTAHLLLPTYLHFATWALTIQRGRMVLYAVLALTLLFSWPLMIQQGFINFGLATSATSYAQVCLNTFFVILLSTGIRSIYRSTMRGKELQQLREQRAESELASLRAQLNPHFLFNTLNNIHGVNIDDPTRGSAMLLELADVMRYHYELSRVERILLAAEVALIRSVAALETLRLRENTQVTLQLCEEDAIAGRVVPPLLLIPFVENAFKHGAHPTVESSIYVELKVTADTLVFTTINSLHIDRNTVSTGVGISNVRQRLDLLYGNRYQLEVGDVGGQWQVQLTVPLEHEHQRPGLTQHALSLASSTTSLPQR